MATALIILITLIFVTVTGLFIYREYIEYKREEEDREKALPPEPTMTYEEITAIIDEMIARCFRQKFLMDVMISKKYFVKDFAGVVSGVITDVFSGLSDSFIKEAEYYVNVEYLITRATRDTETMLMQFIRDQKISVKDYRG